MSVAREFEELRATVQNQAQIIQELQVRVLALDMIMTAWSANFPLPPRNYKEIQQGVQRAKKMSAQEKEEVLEHVRFILYQDSSSR